MTSNSNSFLWSSLYSLIIQMLGFVRLVFINSKINSTEFGLYAILMTALMMIFGLNQSSFYTFFFKQKNVNKIAFNNIFLLSLIFHSAVVFIGLALLLVLKIGDEKFHMICTLLLIVIFNPFYSFFENKLTLEKKIIELSKFKIISEIFSFALLLFLINLINPNINSVLIAILANRIIFPILCSRGLQIRKKALDLNLKNLYPLKKELKYGRKQSFNFCLNFISKEIDQFIIPLVLGLETSGFYYILKNIFTKPRKLIEPALQPIILADLRGLAQEKLKVKFITLQQKRFLVYISTFLLLSIFYPIILIPLINIIDISTSSHILIVSSLIVSLLISSIPLNTGLLVKLTGVIDNELTWSKLRIVINIAFGSFSAYFFGIEGYLISLIFISTFGLYYTSRFIICPVLGITQYYYYNKIFLYSWNNYYNELKKLILWLITKKFQ